jgi:hypothetical protein
MRIAFITGSIAQGRDGVGDYARRLSGELARNRCASTVIAWNEPFATETCISTEDSGSGPVDLLALPAALPAAVRLERARTWLSEFAPDWLSLQYSPFAFHPRGLPFGLAPALAKLAQDRLVHIMFHETWVSETLLSRPKHWLLGRAQRELVRRMASILSPDWVNTSNARYALDLRRLGLNANVLPLFGNIPICPRSGWLLGELPQLGVADGNRDGWLLLGIFGAVHPEWAVNGWWDYLVRETRRIGRRIALLGIGRVAGRGLEHFHRATAPCRRDGVVHHFGEQPADRISDFLQSIDGGISTTPLELIGKSGSAAAMADHGVPVLATRERNGREPYSLYMAIDAWLALRREPNKPRPGASSLDAAARNLSHQLLVAPKARGLVAPPRSSPA